MIKDLQLMRDISPLFEKKLVIWGIGQKGRMIIEDIKEMGAGKNGIFLCDSFNNRREGGDDEILSPEELQKELDQLDRSEIIILVTAASTSAQDEIIKDIRTKYGETIEIYTEYAIEWGIYLNIQHSYVDGEYRKRKLQEHKENRKYIEGLPATINAFKYFAFLPLYKDEIILVYQPGKVASASIYKSISNLNRHVLHVHVLTGMGYHAEDLYNLLNIKSGKIISLVRDPIARQISVMWQNIHEVARYSDEVDFPEIEEYYFKDGFENEEFEWFELQMKKVFKIDVFDYSFDKEKGYSIIKEGNIELLLIKVEKLNELEQVIGDFLKIEQFQIENNNVGEEKPYRFAYRDYKKEFTIKREKLTEIYKHNKYMQHFYSEQELDALYMKWMTKMHYI